MASSRSFPFSTRNPFTSSDDEDEEEEGKGKGKGKGNGNGDFLSAASNDKTTSFNPFDDSDEDEEADSVKKIRSPSHSSTKKTVSFSSHSSFIEVQKWKDSKCQNKGSEALVVEERGGGEGKGRHVHSQTQRLTEKGTSTASNKSYPNGISDFDGMSSGKKKYQSLRSTDGSDQPIDPRSKETNSFKAFEDVGGISVSMGINDPKCMKSLNGISDPNGISYSNEIHALNGIRSSNFVNDSNSMIDPNGIPSGELRKQLLSGGTKMYSSDRTMAPRSKGISTYNPGKQNDGARHSNSRSSLNGINDSNAIRTMGCSNKQKLLHSGELGNYDSDLLIAQSPPRRLHFDGYEFSEEKNSLQELEDYALQESEDTTKSIWNCIKVAEDMKEEASRTVINLHQQGEKMIQSHQVAVHIDQNLTMGEKLLGSLGGIFSRPWRPKRGLSLTGPLITSNDQSFQSKAKHVNVNVKENRNQSVQLFSGSDQKTVQGKLEMERVKQDDALSDLSNILDQIKDMSIDMGLEISRQNVSLENFYNDASKLEDRVKDANSRGRRLLGK